MRNRATKEKGMRLIHNSLKKLNINLKSMLVIAMLLLTCVSSTTVQARTEIPENITLEKDNSINEIILKASGDITLTGPRNTTNTNIELSWNGISGVSKYNIWQSKNDSGYKKLFSVSGTSTTLTQSNAGIKDEAIPNAPKVTATLTEDKTANNLTITASTDNGTTYKHYLEASASSGTTGYLVFMVDYGKSNAGFVSNAKAAMKVIGRKLIAQGVQIGVVVNGGDSATASWGFTNNVSTFESNIDAMYRITHGSMAKGMPVARKMLNNTGSNNKAILMFQDPDDKWSKSAIDPILKENIKNYLIVCKATSGMDRYLPYGPVTYAGSNTYTKVLECFETMFEEISTDFEMTSNVVTTTVTTGIKGYQYVLTTNSTHTFTNEPIVQLADIPTTVSGEEKMAQYLHIRAIDNAGNASLTNTLLLQVPAKITLKTTYQFGMNNIPLEWTINDSRAGYDYRLYRRAEGEEKFIQIDSSNSKVNYINDGIKTVSYTTPGTYYWTVPEGVTKLQVAVAGGGGRRCSCGGQNTCNR